jgi:DNA invertase Pin-like site-specific DNA recombinase
MAQLRRVLAELDKGDVLMVTRLDRWRDQPAIFLTRLQPLPRRRPDLSPLATHGPTSRPRTGGFPFQIAASTSIADRFAAYAV